MGAAEEFFYTFDAIDVAFGSSGTSVVGMKKVWCNFFELHKDSADLAFDFVQVFVAVVQ